MLATMTDRSLPLSERASAAIKLAMESVTGTMDGTWSKQQNDLAERGCDALLADIAAADRLARAADGWSEDDSGHEELVEYNRTLAAYRARMAQGVGDGHPE